MLTRRSVAIALGVAGLAPATAFAQTAPPRPFAPNHPQYAAALDLMATRHWADLVALTAALPPQSAAVLLEDLGDGSPLADNLNNLARVRGGKSVAGAILIGWAWRYRGSGTVIVNEDASARLLVQAVEALAEATHDDPNDGVAITYLFRGLKGVGESDALHALLQPYLAARRKPVEGLAAYADAISAKWLGSETEALAFARQYKNSAAPASFGIIPDTHVTALVARTISDDAATQQSVPGYFADAAVAAEIVAAHDAFLAAAPDPDEFAMRFAHAQFSFAFLQMRDAERCRLHLAQQGDYVGGPWRYQPDPRDAVARIKRGLGLSAA